MTELDFILDNDLFINQLEVKLLAKFKNSPDDLQNLHLLAQTYRKKGELKKVKLYYTKVLELDSRDENALGMLKILNFETIPESRNPSEIVPSPFYIITDFLDEESLVEIDEIIHKNESIFSPTTVSYKNSAVVDQKTRSSKVLAKKHFKSFSDSFQNKLKKVVPAISNNFRLELNPNLKPEISLTMHLDGDFFKIHMDVLTNTKHQRKLTFVFYYHSLPKGFSGGDLLLFDSSLEGYNYDLNYTKISPVRNSIVFFPSHCYHKVTPINLQSSNYLDGRYTVNGWFHA